MITLQNQFLTARISEKGAELKSLVCNGKEYIWAGDPAVWNESSPILFPICGSMKDDTFTHQGKSYAMPKHGFLKNMLFSVESLQSDRVVLLHTSGEETLKMYPFLYNFRVVFALEEKKLVVLYQVDNIGDDTMFFSVGAHEGYATPGGIEDYDVIFPEEETLATSLLDAPFITEKTLPILKESRTLPLYEHYFSLSTLIFRNIRSKSATLRNRKTGEALTVCYPFAPHLLIWHVKGAPYICLEPWAGLPDFAERTDNAIANKDSTIALPAGQTYTALHSVEIH